MKNKFKSYSFWTALAGAIVVLVQAIGKMAGFIPNSEMITDIVMAIAGVLVVLGVVSAPTPTDNSKQEENSELQEEKTENDSENNK